MGEIEKAEEETKEEVIEVEGDIIPAQHRQKSFSSLQELCDWLLLVRPYYLKVETFSNGGYLLTWEAEV